jgi:hypothetical protein
MAVGLRRVEKAVALRLDLPCAQKIADGLVAGMLDPDGLPVAARIAFDRIWPAKTALELSGPDGGPVEISSQDQWARLAHGFGEAIEEGAGMVIDEPDPDAEPGAD